jgi:ubiquinone/menaquinone biosynthesis C-methylase UbiE
MGEINLLDSYPRSKRPIEERAKTVTESDREIAKQFGREYFDGTRMQGYGGYHYDGRWKPVVKRFSEYYNLKPGDSILDVGAGKGFMLYDFLQLIPGLEVAGVDISLYAFENALSEVKSFLEVGNAKELEYPDDSFDLVISINTIHNLRPDDCMKALQEIERVGRRNKFVVVDAYHNEEEKERFLKWNLTAETYMSTTEWKEFFDQAGYTGDYYWFIPE